MEAFSFWFNLAIGIGVAVAAIITYFNSTKPPDLSEWRALPQSDKEPERKK